MRYVKLVTLYLLVAPFTAYAVGSNLDPFGMELGGKKTSEANRHLTLKHLGNNSEDWNSIHEVEISSLPNDDFYGRDDLRDFVVRVDGIETIFTVHLIYENYGIAELLRDLSVRYECVMQPIEGMGKSSGSCESGRISVMAYGDKGSGYSHIHLTVERPEEGKKPTH